VQASSVLLRCCGRCPSQRPTSKKANGRCLDLEFAVDAVQRREKGNENREKEEKRKRKRKRKKEKRRDLGAALPNRQNTRKEKKKGENPFFFPRKFFFFFLSFFFFPFLLLCSRDKRNKRKFYQKEKRKIKVLSVFLSFLASFSRSILKTILIAPFCCLYLRWTRVPGSPNGALLPHSSSMIRRRARPKQLSIDRSIRRRRLQ